MSTETGSDAHTQVARAVRPMTGPHHGNTVAAWVMVMIMSVGALVMAVAVGMWNVPVFVVGVVVVAVGLVVGKVLSLTGYGAQRSLDGEQSEH